MSKKEIPDELRNRLDEFDVEVPEISPKNQMERLANWIYAPAKNPMELLGINGNSIIRLTFFPLILVLILFFTPIFLL
ncbi:hypothetical protein [Gracilibacillus alcaliphilus]|uniref:hypothetical protein n=1 Tax=Gracilibacillus alcaliphilus TaxID=1401441 RepID=UPI00195ED5C6|nr:hypothetical protein [Gracilibacillus alcaliphilus]MBM7679819.1 hypothetical protein [Gracilibacillus alcaliphilus]